MSKHIIVINENLNTNFEFIHNDDVLFLLTRNFLQKRTFFANIHLRKTMRKTVKINNNKTLQKISQETSQKISQKTFIIFKRNVISRVKLFNNAIKTFNKFKFYIMLKISTNTQINCLNNNEFDMHYIQSNDDNDI